MEPSTPSRPAGSAPSTAEEPLADTSLPSIMARLASGEGPALLDLLTRHGDQIGRVMGGIARQRGVLHAADQHELIVDGALELAELAGAWDPAGAPPWVWAHRRLAAVVDRHLGQWARSIDDPAWELADAPAASAAVGHEPELLALLDDLGAQHPSVALLREATERVASGRDQLVFFETAVQVSLGDRSPAVTVGRLLGMQPAAVRQQHRRVRLRLLELAASDTRFAPLVDLAVLAAPAA